MADERSRPAVPKHKGWRPHAAAPGAKRSGPLGRGKKIFALLAVMVALGGALVGFLLYVRLFHAPVFVSLPVTEYGDRRFRPNAFAQQDARALLKRFDGKGNDLAYDSQQGDLLKKKLGELSSRTESALVLHVSSLAVCREGKVYLLPADADPDHSETWLPLDAVLQAVRDCPVPHKLLILDVMKPVADPRLGILRDDVAEHVEQSVRGMQDCPFWVLCACSPGQVSLVSEDLQRSVFGYYLELGLQGRAENAGPTGKTDGRIMVRELAAYVAARVDRWAVANRSTRQTPLLLGGGADFELSEADTTPESPAEEAPEAYPKLLAEGWTMRDGWQQDGGLNAAPGIVRNLDATLLWAERRWRGGFGLERVSENPATNWSRARQQMDKERPGARPRSRSLFLAVTAAKQDPDENTLFELRQLAAAAEQAAKEKDPATATSAKVTLDVNAAVFLKKFDKQPLLVAEAAYQVALGDPQFDKVRFLAALVQNLEPKPLFAETAQLKQLAETDPKKWPSELRPLHILLQIARDRERTTSCDPELLPWIANRLRIVAEGQHQGVTLLFQGDPATRVQAEEKLQEAVRGLSACQRALEELQEARLLVGQAMELLPGAAAFLVIQPGVSDGDERSWHEGAHACRELFVMFQTVARSFDRATVKAEDAQTEDPFVIHQDALRRNTAILRDRFQNLREPFLEANVKLLVSQTEKPDASPTTFLKMQAVLASPLLPADQRAALWKAAQTLSRQLHARMEAADADKDHPPASVPAYDDSQRDRQMAQERARANRRARLSLGLLRLGGCEQSDLEQEETRLEQNPSDAAWEGLGNKLRDTWSREIPSRLQDLLRGDNLSDADALNRISPPFDAPPAARSRENQADPAAEVRRRQERKSWAWLAGHYRKEAMSYSEMPAAVAFYGRAADEFLQFAR
jgi:hypothetical protein